MTELINPQPGWSSEEKNEYEKARQKRLTQLAKMREILTAAQAALKEKDRNSLDRLLQRLENEKKKFIKKYPTIYRIPLETWYGAWERMDADIHRIKGAWPLIYWEAIAENTLYEIKKRQTALEEATKEGAL